MMTRYVLLILLFSSAAAAAEEAPSRGKQLHDAVCLTCHKESNYTRPERRIHSLDQLRKQVANCRDDAGAGWDATETEEVVQYLNTRYYHF